MLLPALALCLSQATATATVVEPSAHAVPVADEKGTNEVGFMDRFLPFSTGTVDKRADDGYVLTFVGNLCLPFGGLWMPIIVMKEHPGLNSDIIITYIVDAAFIIGAAIITSITVIGPLIIWVAGAWISTNAVVKATDRAYRGAAIGGSDKPAEKKSARRESGPHVAMAY